jgi:hypothetical protein
MNQFDLSNVPISFCKEYQPAWRIACADNFASSLFFETMRGNCGTGYDWKICAFNIDTGPVNGLAKLATNRTLFVLNGLDVNAFWKIAGNG